MYFKKYVLLGVNYIARMHTVTSVLCYIENLIFLENNVNNIAWFWKTLDVQSTDSSVDLFNTLLIRGSFLSTFYTSFRKIVHNSKKIVNLLVSFLSTFYTSFRKIVHNLKEIVNLLGLLACLFVDIKTYPLTKYYYFYERVYFIYRLFILFISTFSFLRFLYSVSWRYKRDYRQASINV